MIDGIGKVANALQFLRLPSVVVGLVGLAVFVTIVARSNSHEQDYYLIPSAVGMLWSITAYVFLTNFHSIPPPADPSWKFFGRLKRKIVRAWYWLLGIVFVGTTIGAMFVSYRMAVIWFRDYAG